MPRSAAAAPRGLAVTVEGAPEAAEWDALLGEARPGHPHYGRHVIDAHRAAGLLPEGLRFVAVRRGGFLAALLPFVRNRDLSGLGGHVALPWTSPFVTATAPLVALGGGEEVHDALVAGLALGSGNRPWRWPSLAVEEGTGAAMRAAMGRAGWTLGAATTFGRPVLDRRASHDAFLAGHPNGRRLKDLRRRGRRLGEIGAVAHVAATEGPDLRDLIEAFLGLEQSGWKGRAGTAMACRPDHAALARTLFAPGPGPVRGRADALTLGGRPIAISLALVAGGTATLLKTAYDEALRAHAPGLLLEAEIVRAFHAEAFAQRLDSATSAGSALESLYPDRQAVSAMIALPPGAGKALSLERRLRLVRFEDRAREAARSALRRG
ncbi:GNAT family N-acetyltransferase [Methylobacterium sp. J-076]|uniref:GNAT family N-acetyltransferase n=1 Tax=Methylobacterium sp. J-076 TaxID=2836655 RepID=UPI001FB8919C|nr:GNAT family N-acetyltransferase [Methylobacterium sp. J-076]MCJ2012872.1 GNAT family N-acetyltransferase [Methylobacterium sp. J-076]